jgi:hypothetical protein
MPDYKSARLGKLKKIDVEKAKDKERLNAFMKRRRANRDKEMSNLRDERLKLNKLSKKDIGK